MPTPVPEWLVQRDNKQYSSILNYKEREKRKLFIKCGWILSSFLACKKELSIFVQLLEFGPRTTDHHHIIDADIFMYLVWNTIVVLSSTKIDLRTRSCPGESILMFTWKKNCKAPPRIQSETNECTFLPLWGSGYFVHTVAAAIKITPGPGRKGPLLSAVH